MTENTTGKLLAQNKNINQNKFKKCGVYQLTSHDCNKIYWADWQTFLCIIPRTFPGL